MKKIFFTLFFFINLLITNISSASEIIKYPLPEITNYPHLLMEVKLKLGILHKEKTVNYILQIVMSAAKANPTDQFKAIAKINLSALEQSYSKLFGAKKIEKDF